LYPIILLALFLVGASLYLRAYLQETLEFHLYLPHSRLQNPWDEVLPALARTGAWGGGAFLVALACWGWRRFGRLRRDLNRVADWMFGLDRQGGAGPALDLTDPEVKILGNGLHQAAESFETWDREVEVRARALADAVAALGSTDEAGRALRLRETRAALQALGETLAAVGVDEGIS
jgi:hypothetical protein